MSTLQPKIDRNDAVAVRSFVREFEGMIQRSIRPLIRSYKLTRIVDVEDISQVVLADFFRDDRLYRNSLKCPIRLGRLLVRMARNKVLDEARKHQADCRDHRRVDALGSGMISELVGSRRVSPSSFVAGEELVREIFRRLTDEERLLAELRVEGESWANLADICGMKTDALRKRLTRAFNRVSRELKLDLQESNFV